jgi:hypothetical protein
MYQTICSDIYIVTGVCVLEIIHTIDCDTTSVLVLTKIQMLSTTIMYERLRRYHLGYSLDK